MRLIWPQYLFFELFSLLLAILFNKGLKKFKLSAFIPLLFVVCITEFIGSNLHYFGWKKNYLIYNCYIVVSYPIIYYAFERMLRFSNRTKMVYYGVGAIISIFLLANFFFLQGEASFDTYSLILTELIFILLSLVVLMDLFKDDDYTSMIYHHPYYWICSATLIFGIGTLMVLGLQKIIVDHNLKIGGSYIYKNLLPGLSDVLYTGYSYAFFLCHRSIRKSR